MKRTVAIVGFAPSTRMLAPWNNPDIEIWGVNEEYGYDYWKRKEGKLRWFQLHERRLFTRKDNHNDPNHLNWLKEKHDFPIYMQQHWDEFPSSVKFPLDEIRAKFEGKLGENYYTSTLALLLAFAAYEGFERVELYGFELGSEVGYNTPSETEYGYQRPGAFYWAGMLRGMGIEVYVPPQAGFLHPSLKYGYDDSTLVSYGCLLDMKHQTTLNEQLETVRKYNNMKGALVAVQQTAKKHKEVEPEIAKYEKAVEKLMHAIKMQEGMLGGLDTARRLLDSTHNQNMEARDA